MAGETPAPRDRSIPVVINESTIKRLDGKEVDVNSLLIDDESYPTHINLFSAEGEIPNTTVKNTVVYLRVKGMQEKRLSAQGGFEAEGRYGDSETTLRFLPNGGFIFEYNPRPSPNQQILKEREFVPSRGLARLVKDAREDAGLFQQALAKKADVSISTLNRIERGNLLEPYRDSLIKLLNALDIHDKDKRLPFMLAANYAGDEDVQGLALVPVGQLAEQADIGAVVIQTEEDRFKRLFEEAKTNASLTQSEIAVKLGIPPGNLSRIERGLRLPTRQQVLGFADVLNIRQRDKRLSFFLAAYVANEEDMMGFAIVPTESQTHLEDMNK